MQGLTCGPVLSSPAPYIIIQGLVIQLLQLCLVIPELDPVQHLCQQQNQGIFVPAATRKTHRELGKTLPAVEISNTTVTPSSSWHSGYQLISGHKVRKQPWQYPISLWKGKGGLSATETAPEFKTGKAEAACQEQHQVSTNRRQQEPLGAWAVLSSLCCCALNEEQRNQGSCSCLKWDLEPVCAAVSFPTLKFRSFSPETKPAPFLLAL